MDADLISLSSHCAADSAAIPIGPPARRPGHRRGNASRRYYGVAAIRIQYIENQALDKLKLWSLSEET
jgi:hypothetical protein